MQLRVIHTLSRIVSLYSPLLDIDLIWSLAQLLDQDLERLKRHTMNRARPMFRNRLFVFLGRIAFVRSKIVLGPLVVHLHHDAIACHLGNHRGSSNTVDAPVP
jgi:hypothetical protein